MNRPCLPLHYLHFRDRLCSLGIARNRQEDRHWRPETARPALRQGDSMPAPLPLPLPKSRAEIRKIQSERKRAAFERAKKLPWYSGKLDKIDARAARRQGRVGENSGPRQGHPAQARSCRVHEAILLRAAHRDRRILALRRLDRQAGVLSAHRRRCHLRASDLGPLLSLHEYRQRRPVPYLLPDRHPSGRPGLGAQRALVRCRHELGRRRQCLPLRCATRPRHVAEADRVHRHVELRAASGQSRRGQGYRPRRLDGDQGGVFGRDAVAGQAREDRAHVGRAGL